MNSCPSGPGGSGSSPARFESLLAQLRKPGGGFTYNPTTDDEPKEGLALSIYEGRSEAFPINDIVYTDFKAYIKKNADVLRSDPTVHLGGWVTDGKVCLDLVVVLPQENHEEAVRLCRAHDQKAYYDLKNKKEIVVDSNATSGGALKGYENGGRNEETRAGPLERPEANGGGT